eukprot:COSAG02_NODE_992_length_15399_cov_164.326797_10_plen_240_part_00
MSDEDDVVVMEEEEQPASPQRESHSVGEATHAAGGGDLPAAPVAASPPVSPLMQSALECVNQSSEEALVELERQIACRRRKLVGEPRTHGLRYRAVRRAQLRQTIDMDSQKRGCLEDGDVVTAKQVAVNEAGIVRVLCATVDTDGSEVLRGWASAQSVESETGSLHSPSFVRPRILSILLYACSYAALGDLTHVEVLRCLAAHSIARPKMRATSLGIAGLGKAGPGYNTREVWDSRPWE